MSTLPEKDLPPGRHRLLKEHLMTEFRQETQTDARPARRVWPRPALVAVAAAAVAAGVLVALPSDGTGSRDTAAAPGGTGAPGKAAGYGSDDAARLLEDIALAASKRDAPARIRDDQFVYVKSRIGYMSFAENTKPELERIHDREVWASVDGTREGLLDEDNRNGRIKLDAPQPGDASNTDYRSLQKLPTDPSKMHKWLYDNGQGDKTPEDERAFNLFGDLVGESLVPKKQAVALYRAAARIKAVEVVDGVKDAAGRTGVALVRENEDGYQEQLVFDPRTKEYLGERVVAVRDTGDGLKKGQLLGTSAILDREIVDKAGRRP
ncbi:CU044_5270 family protein [Streptomyces uncialis]|uniref:CU044_5270 family protein n=1 Tax=Streptomyces uncialis TaxID=1048205 RepID=UPI0022525A39|nr:CU044_5270 family protein [Streptomyces uncialis]MCX4664516.1 CU044_5270 family protein [Streptomyces uncialis]